jgi:hypothetical protein
LSIFVFSHQQYHFPGMVVAAKRAGKDSPDLKAVYLDSDFTGGLDFRDMSSLGMPNWPPNSASWARLIAPSLLPVPETQAAHPP